MKINLASQYTDKSKQNQSFKAIPQKRIILPEPVGEIAKRAGYYINTPEQKLFLAASTLMLTPLLDLKFADDDKKVDTAIKSASKAVAGGVTGVAIRAGFQAFTKKFIQFDAGNVVSRCFFPGAAKKLFDEYPELATARLDQYRKTMGTLFAVIFMILFSNSKVDVPFTGDMQDLLSGVIKEKKSWISSFTDVAVNRKEKIHNWLEKKKNRVLKLKNKVVNIAKIIRNDDVKVVKADDKK